MFFFFFLEKIYMKRNVPIIWIWCFFSPFCLFFPPDIYFRLDNSPQFSVSSISLPNLESPKDLKNLRFIKMIFLCLKMYFCSMGIFWNFFPLKLENFCLVFASPHNFKNFHIRHFLAYFFSVLGIVLGFFFFAQKISWHHFWSKEKCYPNNNM